MRAFVTIGGWVLVGLVFAMPVLAPVRLIPPPPSGRHAAKLREPPGVIVERTMLWIGGTGTFLLLVGYLAWPVPHHRHGWIDWESIGIGVIFTAIGIDRLYRRLDSWSRSRTPDGIYDPAARRAGFWSQVRVAGLFYFAVALAWFGSLGHSWTRLLFVIPVSGYVVLYLCAGGVAMWRARQQRIRTR